MRPSTLLTSTVIGSLLLLAGSASAQTYRPRPPPSYPPPRPAPILPAPIGAYPEQHDHEGFFARVYLGIHYRFADTEARSQGRRVANYTFKNVLQPIDKHGNK